ncbi:MAG: acyltransferase [Chloroflexi bacterium]|nr:acyltransferase [Chloroflexota bacterium]
MEHTRYRADIDGLRAIAVLSVLLFHVDVTAFSGGYVGVDVFFVISGFLITRLIRDEVLKTGKFSFANFYLRRARRLLPGFFFALALCFVAAFFLFPPPQMESFSKSLSYSIISLANFHFWGQSGYFDTASIYKPLLHIWSLSVEEQFYLVWPLLLVLLLVKTPRRMVPAILLLGFSLSLYMNFVFADGQVYVLTKYFPTASEWFAEGPASIFYLMPFRIFEFAIGALLVWVIEYQPKNKFVLEPLMLAGLIMTIYPMLTYTEKTLFPSYNALMPCFGAALLIYGGGDSRYCGSLLRTPVLVEIGKISYSLYLIHWPVIVFFKYYAYDFGSLSLFEKFTISAVSILAARLMYIYVEQPFRKSTGEKQKVPTRVFLTAHGALGIILIALAVSASNYNGWAWRMPNSLTQQEITRGQSRRASPLRKGCNILDLKSSNCRPDASLQVLLAGDSHYYVGYNMFAESFRSRQDINLIIFSAVNDCSFTIEDNQLTALGMGWKNKGKCQERAAALSDPEFNEQLDVLVISSQYMFRNGSELPILEYLKSKNKDLKVVVIGPYIEVSPYQCADIINRFGGSAFCKDERFVSYFGEDVKNDMYYAETMQYKPLYIDIAALLCSQGTLGSCLTEAEGVPMMYDGNHPSLEFSLLMGRRMLEEYSTELGKIGFTITGK